MEQLTTISLNKRTKQELEKLKLCEDESYNSLLKRVLPDWADLLLKELNKKEKSKKTSPSHTDEKTNIT